MEGKTMSDKAKEVRQFWVAGQDTDGFRYDAKTPREAALKALVEMQDVDEVEVFEVGRGRRYVRTTSVKPAGKAE